MKQIVSNKTFITFIVGNILDHYNLALYSFLIPILSSVFFPDNEYYTGLVVFYGFMSLNFIFRPIGGVFFAKKMDISNSLDILSTTLFGVFVTTFCIGLIPKYENIGYFAPLFFLVIKGFQGFFAAGEISVSSIAIFSIFPKQKDKLIVNTIYLFSTMFGIQVAHYVAYYILNYTSDPYYYWRYAFFSSAFTGIVAWILRLIARNDSYFISKKIDDFSIVSILRNNKLKIFHTAAMNCFSYSTYAIPFLFLNKFLETVNTTNFPLNSTMYYDNILLLLNCALMPIMYIFISKFDKIVLLKITSILVAISILPLFYYIETITLFVLICFKIWIIVFGLIFSIILNVWLVEKVHKTTQHIYSTNNIGYTIGSEMFGKKMISVCWLLWIITDNTVAPGCYIFLISIVAIFSIYSINTSQTLFDNVLKNKN